MSKGYLCMFSGGIDSTALLHMLLSRHYRPNHRIYVHHIKWGDTSKSNAEQYAVRDIISYYQNGDFKDFSFAESTVDLTIRSKRGPMDLDVAAFVASQFCLGHRNIELVGLAVTADDFKKAEESSATLQRYTECAGIFYNAMYSRRRLPEIYYPTMGATKASLWDIIPEEVQSMVWSCMNPVWEENSARPTECGECETCLVMKESGIR